MGITRTSPQPGLCKMSCHQLVWAAVALGLILVFCGQSSEAVPQYAGTSFTEDLRSYEARCRNANGRAVAEKCPTCADCQLGWCSPVCDVWTNPECCYNRVCQKKRSRSGCEWFRFL